MTAAARRRQRNGDENLDVELTDLPPAARWREWMLRVEAAVFASARPVPRETLVRLVGEACRFDDLIADLIHELRSRPYDLTLVAGGYALRTKTRFAPAIRAAHPGLGSDEVAELTRTETFALTAIAYLQPVTRGEISRLAGREISRDVIAAPIAEFHPGPSRAVCSNWIRTVRVEADRRQPESLQADWLCRRFHCRSEPRATGRR
jgi:segregation and condensation protein B